MLSNDPTKRISAQVSAGLNRREEVELTHFERPVLDIEGLNSRSRNEMMQYSASRGADISEEMMFKQSAFDNSKHENSFMDHSHTLDAMGLSS